MIPEDYTFAIQILISFEVPRLGNMSDTFTLSQLLNVDGILSSGGLYINLNDPHDVVSRRLLDFEGLPATV